MSAFAWAALGIAVGALLPLLFRRRAPTAAVPVDRTGPAPVSPLRSQDYSAVEIRPGSGACAQARAQAGQRHLATAAPPLPLPDCAAARCRCRYAKHVDRRSGEHRRLGLLGAAGGLLLHAHGERRRSKAGRRQADQPG